ncbi:hypothetical protein B0H14DRAFT_2840137 [Mycena olivaceomarginata]|nr:hypothetical protein B0H14DRAFT_2840137 [Mycena olivaceomarginata]
MDGCPLVELQDTAADKAIPFPYIASFRLGRKYDFKVLFDIASPTTLKEDLMETTKIVYYGGIYRDMLTLLRENGLQKMTMYFWGTAQARRNSLRVVPIDHRVLLPETHKGICDTFLLKPSVCAFRQLNQLQDSLCDACAALAETAITTGRAKMWENLPSFFDLHPWSELKNSNEM